MKVVKRVFQGCESLQIEFQARTPNPPQTKRKYKKKR